MQAYYNINQSFTHSRVEINAGRHTFPIARPVRVSVITNSPVNDGIKPRTRLLASKSTHWTDFLIDIMRKTPNEKKEDHRSNVTARNVVVVDPKPNKGFVSEMVDSMERVLMKFMCGSSRPQHYLNGTFAPLDFETPPLHNLPVEGQDIPDSLNGEFMMVAPNPKFKPNAGYHWFDGDGMIHGIRIKNGNATYVSRYVKTSKLKQEEFFEAAKFLRIGDLKGPFGIFMVYMQWLRQQLKVLDTSYGTGTANTSLIYHGGLLLALHECDKPYVLKVLEDGDLQTIGILDYGNRLGQSFTAHPKVDPITGEMFVFGYSQAPPFVTYAVISRDGFMHDPVTITVPGPIMMHDFAITENYAIFMDHPMYFSPMEMVEEKKSIYTFDATKKARFGVLPRYAKNELQIKWFELPNCFIFHNANAWEEGDEVVLICCRTQHPNLGTLGGDAKEKVDKFTSELYEMRFNMKSGLAFQKKLSSSAVDLTRINENYTGRKQRYVYGSIMGGMGLVTGIAKFDLHEEPEAEKGRIEVGGNVKGIFDLGHGRFGSDAIFVPRVPGTTIEEDDGYLILFVHDDNIRKSSAYVIDAKTMSPDPVSIIELPHRIPYGFHTSFVTEEQLQKQTSL